MTLSVHISSPNTQAPLQSWLSLLYSVFLHSSLLTPFWTKGIVLSLLSPHVSGPQPEPLNRHDTTVVSEALKHRCLGWDQVTPVCEVGWDLPTYSVVCHCHYPARFFTSDC